MTSQEIRNLVINNWYIFVFNSGYELKGKFISYSPIRFTINLGNPSENLMLHKDDVKGVYAVD